MGLINIEDVRSFVSQDVGVTIYDKTWTDQSALRSQKVYKVELCPSSTHVRIFFDEKRFFAVPRTSEVEVTDSKWSAFDKESGLHYVIQSERDSFD